MAKQTRTRDATQPVAKATQPAAKATQPVAKAPKAASARRAPTKEASAKQAPSASRKAAPPRPAEAGEKIDLGYLTDFIGFHLRLAQDASYRVFSRHRDKDLVKPGRFPALAIIQLNPGISQSALGRAIARDKSTVSPLIKDLQKNGFITRKPSVYDRRSVTLVLTKKGERTLARLHAHANQHESELDRLIGTSKTRFVAMLDKIVEGMAERVPT